VVELTCREAVQTLVGALQYSRKSLHDEKLGLEAYTDVMERIREPSYEATLSLDGLMSDECSELAYIDISR